MATRLTQSGKTPISERISIFEQKQQTTTTTSSSSSSSTTASPFAASPGRIQVSVTKKSVTSSKNFSQIMSQFGGSDTVRSSSPVTPSPPSSLRSSAQSLNSSNSQLYTPTPAARTVTSGPTIKTQLLKTDSKSPQLKPVAAKAVSSPGSLKLTPPIVSSSNNSFSFSFTSKKEALEETLSNGSSVGNGRDETDEANGNYPPQSPASTPPPLDNLNEWNNKKFEIRRKSSEKLVEKSDNDEDDDHESGRVIVHLDNVRSNKNLNLKNQLGTGSTSGQVRSSYWTSQALQNDNSQKISESLKLDLDFKDEKISSLNKELEDLQTGGASEEEVTSLKRQKHDLEMRLKEQEEEIDDLAGQVQLLEQSRIKLEMSMAAMKKEHRRELSIKEEELEDARAATQKKVKSLEQQLENEHEERLNFVREKHELETKIINLQELAARSADEEQVTKLKKDLKRTKALLKDAQLMVERSKSDSSNKVVMRQLKNQLEDAEFAKTAALKAKQNLELELSDVQQQLDDVMRSKSDLEDRILRMSREKAEMSTQLEDSEEELQEVMKKYKASVSQLSVDQITIQEQANRIADMEEERNKLKEQIAELSSRIESLEGENVVNAHQNRLELKIKELESKLELEQTTRGRMETQINRLKEGIEKINSECDMLRNKELASQDLARKLQRQLRDLREDYATAQQKETEANAKKNELEKQLELSEAETVLAKNDLKLAMKRIEDLQTAITVDLDSESDSISDGDSDSSEEGMEEFLEHHRRAVSVQRERESVAREAEARASIQREVRASIARESVVRTLETMTEEPELKLSEGSYTFDESAETSMTSPQTFPGESNA